MNELKKLAYQVRASRARVERYQLLWLVEADKCAHKSHVRCTQRGATDDLFDCTLENCPLSS